MSSSDCYFFVDMDMEVVNEEDRIIRCLCVECHDQHYPDSGWYYEGSEQGYGPYNYLCHSCRKVLHSPQEEHDEQE